jgi:hypothetical protein
MRYIATVMIFSLLIGAACSVHHKRADKRKPDEIITDTSIVNGTVIAVDYNSRFVTIRDRAGSYATFKADKEVKNLELIHKGDKAVATYIESFGVKVVGPDQADGDIGKKNEVTITIGLKGDRPYSVTSRIIELRAVVDSINHRTRYIATRGQKGSILSFKVGKNIKRFGNVKKGDQIIIYYTEPVGVLIELVKQS